MFIAGHQADHLDDIQDPISMFHAFMTEDMLLGIVQHTNAKMDVLRERIGAQNRFDATYRAMTLDELNALIACLLVAGIRNDNHMSTEIMFRMDCGVSFYR